MKVTTEKLEAFVADRFRYMQGSLDCNRSGIGDPENSAYKEAIDAGLNKRLNATIKRPKGPDEEEDSPGELKFVDDKGIEHRIYRPNEKMAGSLTEGLQADSFGRILRAQIIGDRSGLSYSEKGLSEGIGSAGGFLVADVVAKLVWDLARNQACIFKAGAKSFVMDGPIVRIVRLEKDPVAYIVAENEEVTESQFEISPITLQAVTCSAITKMSLELLQDAPNSAQILQESMGKAIALKMDLSGLTGDGVNAPRGIANCDGRNIVDMGTNGGALSDYSDFSEACEAVANANGIATSVIFSPRSFYALDRLLEATTNAPLPAPESYKNLKKYITNQVSNLDTKGTISNASKAYIGDFSALLVGLRKGLTIDVAKSGDDTFKKCQLRIRAICRFDIAVMNEAFFSVIEGIKP